MFILCSYITTLLVTNYWRWYVHLWTYTLYIVSVNSGNPPWDSDLSNTSAVSRPSVKLQAFLLTHQCLLRNDDSFMKYVFIHPKNMSSLNSFWFSSPNCFWGGRACFLSVLLLHHPSPMTTSSSERGSNHPPNGSWCDPPAAYPWPRTLGQSNGPLMKESRMQAVRHWLYVSAFSYRNA